MEVSVCSTAQLDCRVLPGDLVVGHVKREDVLRASWLILKVALYSDDGEGAADAGAAWDCDAAEEARDGENVEGASSFRAMVLDGDGCTLVMGREQQQLVQDSGLAELVEMAPHLWRAFEFSLGHAASDVPGVINHLARLLSEDDISILHFSTYGSEIFLVQEAEVARAISCIRKKVTATLDDVILEKRSSSAPPCSTDSEGTTSPSSPSKGAPYLEEDGEEAERQHHLDTVAAVSRIMMQRLRSRQWRPGSARDGEEEGAALPASEQLVLRVMPKSLLLARIKKEYVQECSWILTKLWLFGDTWREYGRRSSGRRIASTQAAAAAPGAAPSPAVADKGAAYKSRKDFGPLTFCEMEGEITLLLRDEDYRLLPSDAVVACPQRWVPIKLCGRRFDFNEVGVVSAMSKVDTGVPILNVSTFLTNVTLVEGRYLEQTIDTLSAELDASIDGL